MNQALTLLRDSPLVAPLVLLDCLQDLVGAFKRSYVNELFVQSECWQHPNISRSLVPTFASGHAPAGLCIPAAQEELYATGDWPR